MLTQDQVRSFLRYDPETGKFTRLHRDGSWRPTGGVHKGTGYRVIGIKRVPYFEHRLAWLYMTGAWPERQIDHRNRNRTDNRWDNLRVATDGENKQNKGRSSANTTGFLGVSIWPRRRGVKKFVAQLVVEGKRVLCTYHRSPEEAHLMYLVAKLHFHPAYEPQIYDAVL